MQERRFTEKDWKLFRNKAADWQESYMDRLNKEYMDRLNKEYMELLSGGAIGVDDLEEFSEELKETIDVFINGFLNK